MKFTIPLKPISVNNAYSRNRQGRRFLTNEGKEFKNYIGWLAKKIHDKKESLDGTFTVDIVYYFKDNRRRDVDGYNKLILDALTGIFWNDDSQITQLCLTKNQKARENKIEVEIIRH